jgi:CubicO group peptidase (beta-lactamase class C family)
VEIEIISGNVDTDGDGISFLSLSVGNLIVEDADELSNLMGQQLFLTFSLSDGRGKSSEVQGTILVDNRLTFASVTNLENMWVSSDWFGSFYSTGSPWIYHSQLGWLYVYPDNAQGYWFWDAVYSNWWWSNPDEFPYFTEQAESQKWKYFDLGQNPTRVYDFESNEWSIRP